MEATGVIGIQDYRKSEVSSGETRSCETLLILAQVLHFPAILEAQGSRQPRI